VAAGGGIVTVAGGWVDPVTAWANVWPKVEGVGGETTEGAAGVAGGTVEGAVLVVALESRAGLGRVLGGA
jgi:hypothetical protein